MRTRTANWFEVKVRYDKTMEDGQNKKVIEQYVVDAYTFSEAEAKITKEMSHYISGEFEIKAITPAIYSEVFFNDGEPADKWFKVKLSFITIDEKTEKEKHTISTRLVQAGSVSGTVKNVEYVMETGLADYSIVAITETKIIDVFEHQNISKEAE